MTNFLFPTENAWQYASMLLYGEYGTGKTTLASTISHVEHLQKTLLIDFDGSSRSVLGNPNFPNVKVVRITHWTLLEALASWMLGATDKKHQKNINALHKHLGDPEQYKSYIWDNLGAMYQLALDYGLDTDDVRRPHELVSSQQDYKIGHARFNLIAKFWSEFSDQRQVAMIYTAHARVEETTRQVLPMLSGQLATKFSGSLSMVGYTSIAMTGGRKTPKGNQPLQVTWQVHFRPFDNKVNVKTQNSGVKLAYVGKNCNMPTIYADMQTGY